jgi:hypothetical protein
MNGTIDDEVFQQEEVLALTAHSSPGVSDASPPCSPPSPSRPHAGSRDLPRSKQVGFELGISEITVKAHRGRVMRKMQAGSLADLVIMAARLG